MAAEDISDLKLAEPVVPKLKVYSDLPCKPAIKTLFTLLLTGAGVVYAWDAFTKNPTLALLALAFYGGTSWLMVRLAWRILFGRSQTG